MGFESGSSDYEATELTTRPGRIVKQEIEFNPTYALRNETYIILSKPLGVFVTCGFLLIDCLID